MYTPINKFSVNIFIQLNIHLSGLLYAEDKVLIQKTEDQLQRAIFKFNNIIQH